PRKVDLPSGAVERINATADLRARTGEVAGDALFGRGDKEAQGAPGRRGRLPAVPAASIFRSSHTTDPPIPHSPVDDYRHARRYQCPEYGNETGLPSLNHNLPHSCRLVHLGRWITESGRDEAQAADGIVPTPNRPLPFSHTAFEGRDLVRGRRF